MPSVEETLDESIEVEETTPVESTEEEAPKEPDYTELLSNLKYQYDKQDFTPTSIEEARELLEMGRFYRDRGKERLESYKADPLSNWAKSYMKESGYEDPMKFIEAVRETQRQNLISEKTQEYVERGISEDAAKLLAEKDIALQEKDASANKNSEEQAKQQRYANFITWYDKMKSNGVFKNDLHPDEIPQSVWDKADSGTPLEQAYLEHVMTHIKVDTQQETLKALKTNKETSTGSVQEGSATDPKKLTIKQIEQTLEGMTSREASKWIDKNYAEIEKAGYFKM